MTIYRVLSISMALTAIYLFVFTDDDWAGRFYVATSLVALIAGDHFDKEES